MTLKRLMDGSEGDFASALLRSAALDVPSSNEVRRGVLAVTAAGSALASSGAVGAAGSAAAAASAAPTGLAALGAVGLAKWVGIGLAAGFVTAGTGAYVATDSAGSREAADENAGFSAIESAAHANAKLPDRHEEHRRSRDNLAASERAGRIHSDASAKQGGGNAVSPARSSGGLDQRAQRRDEPAEATATAAPGQPASSRAEAQPPRTPGRESVTSYPHEARSTTPARHADAIAPQSSERAHSPAMSAELAALARARTALAARAPGVVLAELDNYRRLSRTHVLDAEAFVLRLEALVQLGRAAEAAKLAQRYLAANPSSPHRVRLAQVAKLDDR